MLARDSKIKNLILQRDFIEEQLKRQEVTYNPSLQYFGYLYPENREYFECEGYDVKCYEELDVIQFTRGLPLNVFTPKEDIMLSEEEMEESAEFARKTKEKEEASINFALNRKPLSNN